MTTATILGAISIKGRAPLPLPTDGFLRRRHHHPAGTRCWELRTTEPEPEPMSPPATPDWLLPPATDPALEDGTPAEPIPAMGDVTVRPGDYVGRHRDPRPGRWRPAHTRAAARRRAKLGHARPDDRSIEQTRPLDLDRISQILDGGGVA